MRKCPTTGLGCRRAGIRRRTRPCLASICRRSLATPTSWRARAGRMAVMRRIVAGLTDADLGRLCQRSPAPGYPEEERTVIDCIAVVMDEEMEHHRFAVRDLAALEAS